MREGRKGGVGDLIMYWSISQKGSQVTSDMWCNINEKDNKMISIKKRSYSTKKK